MKKPETFDDLEAMVEQNGDSNTLEEMSASELRARLRMGNTVLRMMKRNPDLRDDPRRPENEAKLQAQVRQVNDALRLKIKERRAERGIPDPSDVQVGIKPASLATRAKG